MDLLSVDQNSIMLGERMVIPVSLQNHVLNLLHTGYLGIVRTKMLARSLLWWTEIECDIVKLLQNCEPCQAVMNAGQSSVHSWTKTIIRMQRLHFDFTQFNKKYYLIIIDSFSCSLEAMESSSEKNAPSVRPLKLAFDNVSAR
jgi:hypothetical protein